MKNNTKFTYHTTAHRIENQGKYINIQPLTRKITLRKHIVILNA